MAANRTRGDGSNANMAVIKEKHKHGSEKAPTNTTPWGHGVDRSINAAAGQGQTNGTIRPKEMRLELPCYRGKAKVTKHKGDCHPTWRTEGNRVIQGQNAERRAGCARTLLTSPE